MGVGRERHTQFAKQGEVCVTALQRGPAGDWAVALAIDLRLALPDGREVIVRKQVSVRATQQVGRRRSAQ